MIDTRSLQAAVDRLTAELDKEQDKAFFCGQDLEDVRKRLVEVKKERDSANFKWNDLSGQFNRLHDRAEAAEAKLAAFSTRALEATEGLQAAEAKLAEVEKERDKSRELHARDAARDAMFIYEAEKRAEDAEAKVTRTIELLNAALLALVYKKEEKP